MRIRSLLLAAVLLCLAACGRGGGTRFDSLAILPFSSDDKELAEKKRSLLESIVPDDLSREIFAHAPSDSFKVISSQVVRDRNLPAQSPQQHGKDLKVAAVLSGKLRADGKLSLQLIAVESGELLWAEAYDLVANGIQRDHRDQITRNVVLKLSGRDPAVSTRGFGGTGSK